MEDLDNYLDTDGCPEADNDGDGVLDNDDQCRDDAEDKDKWKDEDGCAEPDNDEDGIADANEACDNEAEDKDNFEDEDGCPDPDNDGDGVLDGPDQCDDKAETMNGFQDGDGCPDDLPAEVKSITGVTLKLTFASKKAELKKPSFKLLDKVAQVLAKAPDVKFEIQGHTDELKTRDDNVKLSQARAEAVKAYLVKKGIAGDRLTAVGYGPDRPVNAKKKGGDNRRIELQIISSASAAAPGKDGDKPPEGPREDDL
jgi:OmpA-OmpF porin, OOP family